MTSHPSLKPLHYGLRPRQRPHFIPRTAQVTSSQIMLDDHLLDVPDARDISPGKFVEFQKMFPLVGIFPKLSCRRANADIRLWKNDHYRTLNP